MIIPLGLNFMAKKSAFGSGDLENLPVRKT
jgi:hypothetical protein